MLKRIRRHQSFEIALQIADQGFIAPPRPAQRNWLINKAMTEFTHNLVELDRLSRLFVPGTEQQLEIPDRTQAPLADQEIMEDWQIPLMRAMAEIVSSPGGHILEVGFGRGVSATFIQEHGVAAHTIIECNDSVVERYHKWAQGYPGSNIELIHAKWQDALDQLGTYDGILFHTYPLDESEFIDHIVHSITFAEHFFPTASAHLKDGGVFTYLTNEIDSLSRAHQRLIFQHFRTYQLSIVALDLPEDVRDSWWADTMAVIKAVK